LAFAYLTYLKERKAEMEGTTKETNGSRSFEERVFARFDAIDNRFNSVDKRFDRIDIRFDLLEKRVVKLESKQYDTKPIWERAIAAIHETNLALNKGFGDLRSQMESTKEEISELRTQIAGCATKEEIGELRTQIAGCATKEEIGELRTQIAGCATKEEIGELRTQIAGCATKEEIGELRTQIAGCATKEDLQKFGNELRSELHSGMRAMGFKIDALNHNVLELQADHRYVDSRLEKVEAQLKPS
jgi:chromosome segregation ATPase